MIITSRAPVRIDFAGAWTDVSYFADAFGGATLNAAIRMHVSGSLEANEEETNSAFLSRMVSGPSGKYVPSSQTALRVNYESTIPPGSGLGTSATLNVVWLALVRREPISSLADKLHIAELAYDIEKTLGIIGGKQDQYASAVGGLNLFEFREEGVTQQALDLTPDQLTELSSLLVLCYTGKQRLSSNIHRNVWSNFRAGKENTLRALFDLRNSAYEAKSALEDWDLEAFARIVSSQRHYMRNLDASTTNAQIEGLFEAVSADIMGGKPCGAGGGGCVFFIARSLKARDRILNTLKDQGLAGLDVVFDTEGLVLERDS